eukprot:UN23569
MSQRNQTAMALSLFFTELTDGYFHSKLLSFTTPPKLVSIPEHGAYSSWVYSKCMVLLRTLIEAHSL